MEHNSHPIEGSGKGGSRNSDWFHMLNKDIISMPDKWEYPWYAAWDLAFHTIALSLVDFDFAKDQLLLMLRNLYAHPVGVKVILFWLRETSFFSRRVATVAMLPFALSRSD